MPQQEPLTPRFHCAFEALAAHSPTVVLHSGRRPDENLVKIATMGLLRSEASCPAPASPLPRS